MSIGRKDGDGVPKHANMVLKKNPDTDDNPNTGKEGVFQGKVDGLCTKEKATVSAGIKRKSEDGLEKKPTSGGIAIKLNPRPKETNEPLVKDKKTKLAAVFNDDSESEEEMPLECKMKMRNIGRDTTTSSGPKSFNKGKQGFTNSSFKVFELSMKPRNNMEKQTVYSEEK